jgi:aminopeptidase-like protein
VNSREASRLCGTATLAAPSAEVGQAMWQLASEMFPICRSITGDGLRKTLRHIQKHIPLELREVPSGTRVFDWTVPKEWNIRDAYIKNMRGERVIDFRRSNLHVVNYSIPVRGTMTLAELRPHLHALPEYPDWVPYRTSYYAEQWGFCLSYNQLSALKDESYEVCIDSTLTDGTLTYGEYYLKGEREDEILISCHTCHPSLANDNLSGVVVATYLAQALTRWPRHYSYRFLFIPGTIGAITWLCLNEAQARYIQHGLVLAGVGDAGSMTYKRSRRGDAPIDRVLAHVLKHSGQPYAIQDFSPYGYDERQYCSPGFNLPVGALMRSPFGQYPQYHTSADNLEFIRSESLQDSLTRCMAALNILEHNRYYLNRNPMCEPQLGRRGLYGPLGGQSDTQLSQLVRLWVLNLSDGYHSLLDIAERASVPFWLIDAAADELAAHDLLEELSVGPLSTASGTTAYEP